jgi:hypothetical protein
MPLPQLLHPVGILIEPMVRGATLVDPDYREPIQQAAHGPQFACPGQVAWTSDERLDASNMGANSESSGYILFRLVDVRAAGIRAGIGPYRLQQNDRFLKIGIGPNTVETDLYIIDLRYSGHYADQGGATLVKAFFKDRFPSKQNRGGVSSG